MDEPVVISDNGPKASTPFRVRNSSPATESTESSVFRTSKASKRRLAFDSDSDASSTSSDSAVVRNSSAEHSRVRKQIKTETAMVKKLSDDESIILSSGDEREQFKFRKLPKMPYRHKEDHDIVDYVFNESPPEGSPLSGVAYWKKAEEYMRKNNIMARTWQSMKERFRRQIVPELHLRFPEIRAEKHFDTARKCYLAFFKNDIEHYMKRFRNRRRNADRSLPQL